MLPPALTWAQGCCTPGTSPLGGLSGGPLRPWALEAGLAFDGYELRQGYRGSHKVPDPGRRRSQVDRVVAYARVGLPGEAALVVELPYDYRMRKLPLPSGSGEVESKLANSAFGDLSTLVLVRALPRSSVSPWGISLGAGVKWATGSVEREQDRLRFPVELQTGTGSNDPLVEGTAYRIWSGGGVSLTSLTRFPREGRNRYQYGTEAHAVALGYVNPLPMLSAGPELRLRAAQPDRYQGAERINTGGWRLMVGPRAIATWPRLRLGIEAAALWPLRQNLNGIQLGVNNQALLSFHWPAQ